jgi:hypothetical protein
MSVKRRFREKKRYSGSSNGCLRRKWKKKVATMKEDTQE